MSVSLQADSTLPQGYILVDGQRVASVSTTGGLSATLAANTVTTSSLVSGAVTTEKIAPGAVVTADLADGAVTAAKMSGGQTGSAPVYGCRAWVNFDGGLIDNSPVTAPSTSTFSVTAGNDFGFYNDSGAPYTARYLGTRWLIPSIGGVAGATLGGVNVATAGFQVTEVISSTRLRVKFLSGQIPTSNQTITGTGNPSTGYTFQGRGIREAGNVSSVIRNTDGDFTVNLTVPMPTMHYVPMCTIKASADTGKNYDFVSAHTVSTSAIRIFTTFPVTPFNGINAQNIFVSVFC